MNYYSFHVGDYAVNTIHLSDEEDLIYRRLIDLYYQTERPITIDVDRAARLIRKSGQVALVESVLSEFFQKTETGYTNKRCEAEITKYHAKADRAKAANDKRWSGHVLKSDKKLETISAPNQEPITKTSSKPKPSSSTGVDAPAGFSEFWSAYPKKVGKGAAMKVWSMMKVNGHLPKVLASVAAQRRSEQWQKEGGRFIPNPATWIGQMRWEDEVGADAGRPSISRGAI